MDQEAQHQQGVLDWIGKQIMPNSGMPIYLQLQEAFTKAIQRGTLRPGDTLPTVRHLATTLRLAPNTVARAYAELQRLELIESRSGAGTTVSAHALAQFSNTKAHQALFDELTDLTQRMLASGIVFTDIQAHLTKLQKQGKAL